MTFKILAAVLLLVGIAHQFELNCKFERYGWDDVVGHAYTCKVHSLNLTQPKSAITVVKGQHPAGGTNDKVNTFLILEQICEYFPVGVARYFKGLEGLAVQKSGLKKITKSDLKPFGDLKSISLFSNELIALESNLFMYNPKLKLISLFKNRLKYFFSNVFHGLHQLERVYFNSNPCINEDALNPERIEQLRCRMIESCAVTEEMIEFAEIEDMNLKFEDENVKLKENLEAIARSLVKTKRKLEKTQESYNTINKGADMNDTGSCIKLRVDLETCDSEKFEMLELIQELEVVELVCDVPSRVLSKNDSQKCKAVGLKVLKPHFRIVNVRTIEKARVNPELITELVIDGQQTVFLPLNVSKFLPKLTKISITNSQLITVNEEAFDGLDELIDLDLSHNQLSDVKFASFAKLLRLDLSHNKIDYIDSTTFRALGRLEELRLNHNLLTKLDSKTFAANKNLEVLFLHSNHISQIAANILKFMSSHLKLLDLTSNDCIDLNFPNVSLKEIEEFFTENCTIEVDLDCRFELKGDYICHAENVEIESRNVRIASVKGDHESNQSDKTVNSLKVTNQIMEFMPRNLEQLLPNLKKISIENSAMKEVDKRSFEAFKDITELTIMKNNLKVLDDDMFGNLTQLEVLNLSSNFIANLTAKAFENLAHLKTIDLSHNRLGTLEADLISAKNLIEKFIFNNNRLTSIDPQIIRDLKVAKLIDFEGNTCIDSKYNQAVNSEKKVMELYGEISFKCFDD